MKRVRGLREQMQSGEEPLLAVAGIWDSAGHSVPCEVIVTNQRLLGFYTSRLSVRTRLFLEQVDLARITAISLRQKTYEPIFRELMVSEGQRRVYIRTPRRNIEALYAALQGAIGHLDRQNQVVFEDEQRSEWPQEGARSAPVYARQEVRTNFERSPLAIILLFVGGLLLEVTSFVLWGVTGSAQVGVPLFVAGLIAVITAIMLRRRYVG